MDDVLIWMSAGELAEAIRNREVSSVEVVETYLRRIEQVNPALNAVVTLDGEGALRHAEQADLALARGEYRGPLHGVPITLKDCHATAGMRTTAGTPLLEHYVPTEDGTVAARMKGAGAIILGKTNVAEMLADAQSTNPIFGRSSNPWDVGRTPGGSSGGAAAAVAAGLTALEIGSDIGGSIRMPAHCCGIFGLKPTEQRVSSYGHFPDLPQHPRTTRIMNCIGPMARSIEDLDLALRVIAGPDGHDVDIPPVPLPEVVPPPLKGLRIAWASSFPGLPVQAATRAAIERLVGALGDEGTQIEETLPRIDFEEQLRTRAALRSIVRMLIDEPPGGPPTALDYFHALERRDSFIRDWEQFFAVHDALICPVMMTTAFGHCERGDPVIVDGEPQPYDLLAGYCRPFNLTGHPVVTLPIGHDEQGLPISVQLVAARWSESRLLGIATEMHDTIPGIGYTPPKM